jgi:hypothetical protein
MPPVVREIPAMPLKGAAKVDAIERRNEWGVCGWVLSPCPPGEELVDIRDNP